MSLFYNAPEPIRDTIKHDSTKHAGDTDTDWFSVFRVVVAVVVYVSVEETTTTLPTTTG